MDIIHLLPDSVANQIAAGEVIQRPASVIKELVENAVDAGATQIDVLVTDAGRTSIQVIDDGKGMSQTDARLAFERHATSKIRQARDLFTLHTMGFRGEALPSIAAVAQVRLTTRTPDHELGTELIIEGSSVVSQQPCSCAVGANFEVRNLFFNIPARRKFLKSNQTELNNIVQEFERIALVNPSVGFTLSHNGSLITRLPASSLRQRIVNVFGKRMNEQLLTVDVDTSLVHLTGFVGRPDAARKKGALQYFFVNGRYMRHPYFHKAVLDAYEQLIPAGEQVPYFLYFQVDPANIDVNIHPTKTEIKFENDTNIWQIIVAAIRETLGRFNAVPTMDFDVEGRPDIPVFSQDLLQDVHQPRPQINVEYNPFRQNPSAPGSPARSHATADWDTLYAGLEKAGKSDMVFCQEPAGEDTLFGSSEDAAMDMSSDHLQFKGAYILTAVRSGLMLIDQHRAHVRILYHRYRNQMDGHPTPSQGLLIPEVLQLPTADALLLSEMTDELHSLGFELSPLGGGSFAINGVPPGIEGIDPVRLLGDIAAAAREADGANDVQEDVQHRLALTMARHAAIVAGQVLTPHEMNSLVGDLFACPNPNLTPDGQTIISIISQDNIERMFN